MSRPINAVPTYRRHKQSGQAVVTIRTAAGKRKDILLGKWKSPESRENYNRLLAEMNSRGEPVDKSRRELSINEVLVRFWKHAEVYYRDAKGEPTSEIREYKFTFKPLKALYGMSPANEFGPRKLAAVRDVMIKSGNSRPVVNRRIGRIIRAFKWATAEELVPISVFQSLRTLAGLRAGRTTAPEPEPVSPVPLADYNATLPHLTRIIRAMAELQRHTGMRPGEVCTIKLAEIDCSGPIWLYRPSHHKLSYRNKARTIAIGPKGQGVILEYLAGRTAAPSGIDRFDLTNPTARLAAAKLYQAVHRPIDALLLNDINRPVAILSGSVLDPSSPLFNPARDREERFAVMRRDRKSKVQPSQRDRRRKNSKRIPGDQFEPHNYGCRIATACRNNGIPLWSPNQLRHLFATEVRRAFGLEAAQVALGHSKADVTQVYAERDEALAVKVAAAVG